MYAYNNIERRIWKMEDVHKYHFGMGLMKKSMRQELVCKSTTKKMGCGAKTYEKNMRYEILCEKVPQRSWHMCTKPHKVELG